MENKYVSTKNTALKRKRTILKQNTVLTTNNNTLLNEHKTLKTNIIFKHAILTQHNTIKQSTRRTTPILEHRLRQKQ